jgi:hypothetical protein
MTAEQLKAKFERARAMIRARDQAQQTPAFIRGVILGTRVRSERMECPPLTLGGLFLLEETEHPVITAGREASLSDLLVAGYILTAREVANDALQKGRSVFDAAAFAWATSLPSADGFSLPDLVRKAIEGGFSSLPSAGGTASKQGAIGPEKGTGNGWTVTLLEILLAEYSWSPFTDDLGRQCGPMEFVLWRLPLAQAFCLYSAFAARNGIEAKGPTYIEKAMLQAARELERAA